LRGRASAAAHPALLRARSLSAFPLRLRLRPSHRLAAALAAAHSCAAVLAWAAEAPPWLKLALSAALLASLAFHLLRDAWRLLPQSVVGLTLTQEREGSLGCEAERRDGGRAACRILGGSVALPWLVVLRLRPQGGRLAWPVALLPDALAAEEFRALRVALRWGYAEADT